MQDIPRVAAPRRIAIGILALGFPSLLLIGFALGYGRSFPVWETWYFIPVWADFPHGPWLSDLFISRWGHISAFPNFINLLLDHLFRYDQRVDIVASVGVSILSLYLLLTRYLPGRVPLTAILLGLSFLSLRASEIWLDGWNTAMTVPLLITLLAGACVLHSRSWRALVVCGLLAFLGINSGGYCLPLLPAVLAVLLARIRLRGPQARTGAWQVVAWLAWTALLLLYWVHMRRGHISAVAQAVFSQGFWHWIGPQLAFTLGPAQLGMAMLFIVAFLFLATLVRAPRKFDQPERLYGLLYMIVYASALAALIGTARWNGSVPIHARYIPFLVLLPCAVLAFAEYEPCLPANSQQPNDPMLRNQRFASQLLQIALVCAALYGDYVQLRITAGNAAQMAALDRAWRGSPYTLTPGMFLHRAFPYPGLVGRDLVLMKRLGLGPFRSDASAADLTFRQRVRDDRLKDGVRIHTSIDHIDRDSSRNMDMSGWAYDTVKASPPRMIYAVTAGCTEAALTGLPRPDVAQQFGPDARASGWMLTLPAACVADSPAPVRIYFVAGDGRWISQTAR